MKFEQLESLINAVSNSTLTELKYEENGVKILLKKEEKQVLVSAGAPMQMEAVSIPAQSSVHAPVISAPAVSAASDTAAVQETEPQTEAVPAGELVKSPLVGTFYAAQSEDAAPYVKVGDKVEAGQVLAIVEAMKLMNEIESDYSGTVTEILVENGEAVEYGQPLFRIA